MQKKFFEFLTHDERVDCLCLGDFIKHPSGTILIRKGVPSNTLRVLLQGEAEVRRGSVVLSHMEAGDAFGEISFLLATPTSADVVATTDVSVLEISAEAIQRLFRQRPGVAAALYRSLAAELARRLVRLSDHVAQEHSSVERSRASIAASEMTRV